MEKLSISVESSQQHVGYPLFIGSHILEKLPELFEFEKFSRVLIVADAALPEYTIPFLASSLPRWRSVRVEINEGKKHIATVVDMWSIFEGERLDRASVVVIVGGGVLGDVVGFAASTYMRGIPFIQVPTTLIAQADSSIGGKVGVNFHSKKNLIGAFQQPIGVVADVVTLRTLSDRHFFAGLAEIIKHGLIASATLLETLSICRDELLSRSESSEIALQKILARSCKIKADIVEKDEREEGGIRKILNFGHTFGHAFESLCLSSSHPLYHGEAVSIGMIAEAHLSHKLGLLPHGDLLRVVELIRGFRLPVRLPFFLDPNEVTKMTSQDKKNNRGEVKWSIVKEIGVCLSDVEAPEEIVRQCIDMVQNTEEEKQG
jgi:3-dehydroquinate synthase